jgi:hypothetical protein
MDIAFSTANWLFSELPNQQTTILAKNAEEIKQVDEEEEEVV